MCFSIASLHASANSLLSTIIGNSLTDEDSISFPFFSSIIAILSLAANMILPFSSTPSLDPGDDSDW